MQFKSVFTICFLLPSLSWASEKTLTLEQAIAQAMAQNPDIQAAYYESQAARARIPQAKGLEDPQIGVIFEDIPIDSVDPNRGEEINYRIQQKIPFPGKRFFLGKAARFNADLVGETSRARIQDVLLDLKKTYYDLYRIDRLLEVNRSYQELYRQLLASTKTAYAAGRTTADPPLKSQVELTKLENESLLLKQERVTHEAHLKAILNRPSHETILIPRQLAWPHLDISLEEAIAQALESRPELKGMTATEKRDRAELTSARQELLPDLDVGLEYNQRPASQDAWTGMAMINLPITFWKKRGEIREAKANLMATRAEVDSMRIHTRHEIEQAYTAVRTTEQIVRSYERALLPQSKTSFTAAQTGYAAGHVDFLTLLDAARTYHDMQIAYYQAQARFGIASAQLGRLIGKETEVPHE